MGSHIIHPYCPGGSMIVDEHTSQLNTYLQYLSQHVKGKRKKKKVVYSYSSVKLCLFVLKTMGQYLDIVSSR